MFILSCLICVTCTLLPQILAIKLNGLLGGNSGRWNHNNKKHDDEIIYSNVCVHSNNPRQFQPNCFLCPEEAYPHILDSCSDTVISGHFEFNKAACVEEKCTMLNKILVMKLKSLLSGNFGGGNGIHKKHDDNDAYSNVCIYSKNPLHLQPKCFSCPDEAYPNVLEACLKPSDSDQLDFNEALCVEANCAAHVDHVGKRNRKIENSFIGIK